MAIISRLLGSGCSAAQALNICGIPANGLSSSGTTNLDATPLTEAINEITTTPSVGSGVVLPRLEVGSMVLVVNNGTFPLNVYPGTGIQIDSLPPTTGGYIIGVSVSASALFFGISPTKWASVS